MLPYTPLHYLLFGDDIDILIMTSANLSDTPMMYRNDEAVEKLRGIADGFLLHNRDIQTRCDDSLLTTGNNSTSSTSNADNLRYTIDENGNIDLPGIGRTQISGLTRAEAAARIQAKFRDGILNDAVVTVAAYNRYITILGEVARPGRQEIVRDNLTLLEAIGQAGDLTITGRRDCIKVIRQEGNESKTYYVDLRSKDLFNSPVYNLQQNDVIYVEPNKVKMGQSTNNDNSVRNISTWLSATSVLTSIAILIFRR